MKILKVFKSQYFWLSLIIILGLLARLYKIDSPIADWHSWRQADTAAVTRNFVKFGFNPLFPKYDDMSGVSEHPVANPATFRFVEFPIYNIATYPVYLIFGVSDMYSRLVSVLFSLGSIVFLYLICKRYFGVWTTLLTAFVYALLPFNVFFSRTTLPEPTFLFFALGMVYFIDGWIQAFGSEVLDSEARTRRGDRRIKGSLGFVFTAIAFLMKPWAIFFFLPLIYLQFLKNNTKKSWMKFLLFITIALLPFVLWRLWILQHPEGIPASNWLMNGDGIRFRPAFWWWLISERMGREMLGVTGLALFVIGVLLKPKKGFFIHVWLISMCLYLVVFATGNVRHNYYQYIFMPVLIIFVVQGFLVLIRGIAEFIPRVWTIMIAFFLLSLSFYFTWTQVKGFYQINNPVIIEAGKKADQVLPKEAVVVAPYNGDTAFLYQINRLGWPVTALPLVEMVTDYGVTHYISTTYDAKTKWVLRHFKVLEDNSRFVIADLTQLTTTLQASDPEP